MKPAKVLFVQPVLAPYSTPRYKALACCEGLEIYVALESDTFKERPGWYSKEIPNCKVSVVKSIKYQKTFNAKERSFVDQYTKAIPLGLIGYIHNVRPNAVVVCNPTEFLLALVTKVWRRFSLGLILEDTPTSEMRKSSLVKWARKFLYKKSDFVFCFSKDAVQYAEMIPISGKKFRSSWSIDSDWYEKSGQLIKQEKHNTDSSTVKFLYVGALSERKGVRALLEAWKSLEYCGVDVRLTLVGDGDLREKLEKYCNSNKLNNVEFTGHLAYESVSKYYLGADVFILPTLEDLFSLVVTEAMAFGLPVLTTIYNGARELVIDGVNGYVFDPLDPAAFKDALLRVVENRDQLVSMGAVSRSRIGEYTHEKVMGNMCTDLASILGKK